MKNIVIIGCSRGIGKALVSHLSSNNNVLALTRNIKGLTEFKAHKNVKISALDISEDSAKMDLTNIIKCHFKTIDVLINNAGLLINKPVLDLTLEDVKSTFNTNVFGLIQSCQAVIPFMDNDNGGHIVNIGSMGGFQGSSKFPGLSAYSASKAAVASFTECLAEELKETNIKTNCLALGAAQTEMLEEAFPGYEAPLSASEMAEFIADFSLNTSKWINGKVLPISVSTP